MVNSSGTATLVVLCLLLTGVFASSTPQENNASLLPAPHLSIVNPISTVTHQSTLTIIQPTKQNTEQPAMTATTKKAVFAYSATFTTAETTFIAAHYNYVVLNEPLNPANNLAAATTIKNTDPTIKILVYRELHMMYTGYDDWAEVNGHEDWFLHTAGGSRIQNPEFGWYLMDAGSSGWRTHFVSKMNTVLNTASYDGVFADDVHNNLPNWWTLSGSLQSADVASWHTDVLGMLAYVQANLTSGKLFYINSDQMGEYDYAAYCTGVCIEGFVSSASTSTYLLQQVNDLKYVTETLSKTVIALSGTVNSNTRLQKYCYAGFLLGFNGSGSSLSFDDWHNSSQGYYTLMDTDLGAPIAVYYPTQNVYRRDFATGVALLNPSSVSRYVALNGTYKLLDGSMVSGVTLAAYSGEVLTLNTTPPATWTLTTSAGANGTVFPLGAQTVNVGQPCVVRAYPDDGYQLAYWVYNGVNTSANNPITFPSGTADSTHTLQAVFSLIPPPPTWTLTAAVSGGHGVVSSASQTAVLTANLTVTATPDVGYLFDYWVLNGAYLSGSTNINPKTVTSGNSTTTQTLIVHFKASQWTLNASVIGSGGTVSSASQTAPLTQDLYVTAVPSANYVFDHWLLNGAATNALNPKTVSSGGSAATQTLAAYFTRTQWTLNSSAGAGGSVLPSGATVANTGTTIKCTATPDVDFTFSSWTLDGVDGGTTNPRYTADAGTTPHTLVANFSASAPPPSQWTLNIIAGVGGTTDPSTATSEDVGTPISVEATANGGYTFTGWLLDGSDGGTDNPVSVDDGGNDSRSIQPVFTEDAPTPETWQLTIPSPSGGETDLTGVQTEDVGTAITVVATADAGYTFSHWVLDGVELMSTSTILLLVASQT